MKDKKSTRKQIDENIESLLWNRNDLPSYTKRDYIEKMKALLDDLEEEAFTRGIQAEYWNS